MRNCYNVNGAFRTAYFSTRLQGHTMKLLIASTIAALSLSACGSIQPQAQSEST